jgi:hypothetical protein
MDKCAEKLTVLRYVIIREKNPVKDESRFLFADLHIISVVDCSLV